jgi:molybdate transport system regulatory protein
MQRGRGLSCMPTAPTVRFRLDFADQCSIGVGKIELLERIGVAGSLSQAARDMRMSYRRAWLLLEDMKQHFEQSVVSSTAGGSGGGGAELTEFGHQVIAAYRNLETQIQRLAQHSLRDLGGHTKPRRAKQAVHVTSLKRKIAADD